MTTILGRQLSGDYHDNLLQVELNEEAETIRPVVSLLPQAVAATSEQNPSRFLEFVKNYWKDFESASSSPGIAYLGGMARQHKVRDFNAIVSRMKPMLGLLLPGIEQLPTGGPVSGLLSLLLPLLGSQETQSPAKAKKSSIGKSVIYELDDGDNLSNLEQTLLQDPAIRSVSRVPIRYLLNNNTDSTPPSEIAWNLKRIKWQAARSRNSFKDAGRIKIAVLDTGIDPAHPDLNDKGFHYEWFEDGPSQTSPADIVGHGTHVAGILTANFNNDIGIRGICECDLHVYKIFSDKPFYVRNGNYFSYVVDPIMYLSALSECLEAGIDVVNLSIGGPGQPSTAELAAFTDLLGSGTTIVAAMGNERAWGSPIMYPAAIPGIIAVGATNIDDGIASFSNAGRHISLVAPGVDIWSTLPTYAGHSVLEAVYDLQGRPIPGNPTPREVSYAAWPGTSMATPHVAAAVALAKANCTRDIDALAMRRLLQDSAERVPGMKESGLDQDFGAGRLNLERLLDAVEVYEKGTQ